MGQETLNGGPFTAVAAMPQFLCGLPAAIYHKIHQITWTIMLARDMRRNWLEKALIIVTTNEACSCCEYVAHVCCVPALCLCASIGWVASGFENVLAWESEDYGRIDVPLRW